MKLRQELTDYLKANTTGFNSIQEVFTEVENDENFRFDARRFPTLEIAEVNTDILQCISGKTSFHQCSMVITVSVLINEKNSSSRNPLVRARATSDIREVDTKAAQIETLVDNLTFDINSVYLQSSQFAGYEESVIDGENKKILQKVLTFNCSYNA